MSKKLSPKERAELLEKFGKRVVQLRKQKKIGNHQHLAFQTGCSNSQINGYEKGKTSPGLIVIYRICEALDITLKEFFEEGFE